MWWKFHRFLWNLVSIVSFIAEYGLRMMFKIRKGDQKSCRGPVFHVNYWSISFSVYLGSLRFSTIYQFSSYFCFCFPAFTYMFQTLILCSTLYVSLIFQYFHISIKPTFPLIPPWALYLPSTFEFLSFPLNICSVYKTLTCQFCFSRLEFLDLF